MGPKEYRGRLSTGCERCRARRIKCDEAKPVCTRCVKSGLGEQCRYRNLVEISFRNESFNIAERAKKTWRSRAKHKTAESPEHTKSSEHAATSSESRSSSSLVPSRSLTPLSLDVTECALNRFFFDYTLPSEWLSRGNAGIFDYIPSIFAKAPPNSSLREAIYAVALAKFDRRTGFVIEGNKVNIERRYGNALRLVAKETQDPALVASDELLLAVQMLGVFEQMSTGGNNPLFLEAHARGLAALLKMREIPVVDGGYYWRMFQSINVQMLSACLSRGMPSFIPYSQLKEFYEDSPYPMIAMTSLIHQGVDLLALWKARSASLPSAGEAEQGALLNKILALDAAFDTWEETVPAIKAFTRYPTPAASTLPSWLRRIVEHPGMPQVAHSYDSLQLIYNWSLCRTMRMLIARVLLAASLKIPGADPTPYEETIQRMVDDTCSSVLPIFITPVDTKPYAESIPEICGLRPYMTMLPLNVAKASLRVLLQTPEARTRAAWIDEVLGFVFGEFHRGRPT